MASGNFAVQNGFFWVLAFVHHFSPVAVVFTFFWTWFVFQWNLFFAVFSVESHLGTTTCCFPVEKPASSSLCLVSVCRQVWKVSCSTAVGWAEWVWGQKCWFYRHWCINQHSRGAVTLVCATNTTGQWAVLVLETAGSNVTHRNFVYLMPCVEIVQKKEKVMLFGILFLNKILINQSSGLIPSHVSALSHMLVTAPLFWCPIASAGAWMCSHREGPGGFRSKKGNVSRVK